MPIDVHPLLRPKDEAPVEPAAIETPLEGGEPEAPVIEEPEAPVAEQVRPERRVIDLDAEDLYQQINRYSAEDPRFANQFNSAVGRKAAREYQPKLTKLEAENARLQMQLQQLQSQGMDEEALKDRLLKDENFRRSYGAQPQVSPEQIELRGQIQAAIAMQEDAVAGQIAPETLGRLQQMLYNGAFDAVRNQQGQVVRQLSPQETLAWYGNALHQEAQKRQQLPTTPPPPPPPPPAAAVAKVEEPQEVPAKPAPQPNTRLAQLSPDLSSPTPQSGAIRMALSDYQKLTPPERKAMFPDLADFEKARRDQVIYDG